MAAILDAGSRVAILAGAGAMGAREELLQAAEILGAPIVKALLGKGVVPDDHPLTTSGIGLLGTRASQQAFEGCDTLPIKIVVMKNNSLGQIKWEQLMFLGNPEYECDLQPIDFARVAEGMGLSGYCVDTAEECKAVLEMRGSSKADAVT